MFTTANLIHSTRMAYQGIFLMGAFCAAMEVEPILQPRGCDVPFEVSGKGMKLDVKCVSCDIIYTFIRAHYLAGTSPTHTRGVKVPYCATLI